MQFMGDYTAEFADRVPSYRRSDGTLVRGHRRARRFSRPVRMKYVPPNPYAISSVGIRQGVAGASPPRPKSKPKPEAPQSKPKARRLTREDIGKWMGNPIEKAKAGLKSTGLKPGGYASSPGNRLRQAGAVAGNVARTRGGKIGIGLAIAGGAAGTIRVLGRRRKEAGRTPNAYANNPYYRTSLDRNIRRTEMGTRSIRNVASGARAASDVSREIRSWRRALMGG